MKEQNTVTAFSDHTFLPSGKVYLVGAGPGDPGLITVKGLTVLRLADVIVFDNLVNPLLLEEAKPGAQKIYVGKTAGRHVLSQQEINALLIEHARHGKIVVRLKGGDPFVFGIYYACETLLSMYGKQPAVVGEKNGETPSLSRNCDYVRILLQKTGQDTTYSQIAHYQQSATGLRE